MKPFESRIREIIRDLGAQEKKHAGKVISSASGLALYCGLSRNALNTVIDTERKTGRANPTAVTIRKLAAATGYQPTWILHGTGPQKATVPDARYPHREEAVALLIRDYEQRVRYAANEAGGSLKASRDPSVARWLAAIQARLEDDGAEFGAPTDPAELD